VASKLTLAEVLRDHWPGYAQANRSRLNSAHYRAVRRTLACRTPELGGRLYGCGDCQQTHFAYHSCNHRSCPQCGAADQQLWSARQEAKLLPVPYFLVTFTIPAELRIACLRYPKELYHLLLRESAAALADVVATKTGGDRCGCVSVLHTWGRQMQHHPHVHCVVPAVALNQKTDQLHHPTKDDFLVHYQPLAARFRSRIQRALQTDHPELYATLPEEALRSLGPNKTWNVQLEHVGRGVTAVRYLARYLQRSAFTPERLLGYDPQGNVLLKWTCSTTRKTGVLTLHPHEFLRRWLLHVLPKGFPRVRHYGLLASAAKKTRIRVRFLLGEFGEPEPVLPEKPPHGCPQCGGPLIFLREIQPSHLVGSVGSVRSVSSRGPPRAPPPADRFHRSHQPTSSVPINPTTANR